MSVPRPPRVKVVQISGPQEGLVIHGDMMLAPTAGLSVVIRLDDKSQWRSEIVTDILSVKSLFYVVFGNKHSKTVYTLELTDEGH